MMHSRWLSAPLVGAALLALTACGGAREPEETASAAATKAAAPAEPSAGDVEFARLTADWSEATMEACGRGLRDALGTRDLVQGALAGIRDPRGRAAAEIEDARHWLAQGDARMDEIRRGLEAGTCDPSITTALDEVWQFYVKAGTSAVQAGQIAGS